MTERDITAALFAGAVLGVSTLALQSCRDTAELRCVGDETVGWSACVERNGVCTPRGLPCAPHAVHDASEAR